MSCGLLQDWPIVFGLKLFQNVLLEYIVLEHKAKELNLYALLRTYAFLIVLSLCSHDLLVMSLNTLHRIVVD